MTNLSRNEYFKTVDGMEVTEVPDGFVIYDEPREKVHYLNPTAAVIYAMCDGNKTVLEMSELLRDLYCIDAAPDLQELFATFEKSGLVCRVK
jgi:hypothetical protein